MLVQQVDLLTNMDILFVEEEFLKLLKKTTINMMMKKISFGQVALVFLFEKIFIEN